jgi:hypothetical protein
LPGLSDAPEQLEAVVKACVEAGAQSISTVLLHLRPGVRDVFFDRLADTHPQLVPELRRRYRDRAYAPKADQQALDTRVRQLVRQYGGTPADRADPRHMTGRARSDDGTAGTGRDSTTSRADDDAGGSAGGRTDRSGRPPDGLAASPVAVRRRGGRASPPSASGTTTDDAPSTQLSLL